MEPQAMNLNFDAKVTLTVVGAFLSSSGPLMFDPIAHVNLVTNPDVAALPTPPKGREYIKAHTGEGVVMSKRVGSTTRKLFTQHPRFEETIKFHVDCPTRPTMITIDIEDADGTFLGTATVPCSLRNPSRAQSRRLMLEPRNASHPDDPLCRADLQRLERLNLDDFGFVVVHWDVSLEPYGGLPKSYPRTPALPPFPLGCTVKAQWLTSASTSRAVGMQYFTFLNFGTSDRFEIESTAPLFAALNSADQLRAANFTCGIQQGAHGKRAETSIRVPLPPATDACMNRDVQWTVPIAGPDGEDWGVLMVSLRLTPKPIDPATLNAPPANQFGRPPPDCPIGEYLPLQWEDNAHIARSTERRWKAACIQDAKPSAQHVRHLLDVVLGRVQLDPNVAQLVSAFYNKPANTVQPIELRELLVAAAFVACPIKEACRFCFVAMRKETEEAIELRDIKFIFDSSMLPRTLDMPTNEITRRVTDIFGLGDELTLVNYDDFRDYFSNNYAHWYSCGVPIEHGTTTAKPTTAAGNDQKEADKKSAAPAAPISPATEGEGEDPWRAFTVRYLKTGRAFAVTAHVDDSFFTVAQMLEESIGLPPTRQQLSLDGVSLEPKQTVGGYISSNQEREVTVVEKEETVTLTLVSRDTNKKWAHKMLASDKVLKLRAHVQQKTMIPLTRIVLTYSKQTLWDRHSIDKYKVVDGSVIEVSSA